MNELLAMGAGQFFGLAALLVLIVLAVAIAAPAMANELRDADLKLTLALPNGAATTTSTSIDTGKTTSQGHQPGNVELLLTAPALTTGQLPDTQTVTYDLIHSDNSDLSSPSVMHNDVLTQTGAGGAGAAGDTFRARMPADAKRYVGFRAVKTGAADASGASATLEALA